MNTQELYDIVLEKESIIITLAPELIKTVRTRLSNLRSRQQEQLGEFADNGRRLEYKQLAPAEDGGESRLRISLVQSGRDMNIKYIEVAGEF